MGDHYEVSGGVVKQYYSASGQRIAMHSAGVLHWLLTDHLGGTADTISGTTRTGELRYRPFGVTRFTFGGSQYASHDYQTRLQAVQTQVSMRRRGNYYDNALMESFWATLKTESPSVTMAHP